MISTENIYNFNFSLILDDLVQAISPLLICIIWFDISNVRKVVFRELFSFLSVWAFFGFLFSFGPFYSLLLGENLTNIEEAVTSWLVLTFFLYAEKKNSNEVFNNLMLEGYVACNYIVILSVLSLVVVFVIDYVQFLYFPLLGEHELAFVLSVDLIIAFCWGTELKDRLQQISLCVQSIETFLTTFFTEPLLTLRRSFENFYNVQNYSRHIVLVILTIALSYDIAVALSIRHEFIISIPYKVFRVTMFWLGVQCILETFNTPILCVTKTFPRVFRTVLCLILVALVFIISYI